MRIEEDRAANAGNTGSGGTSCGRVRTVLALGDAGALCRRESPERRPKSVHPPPSLFGHCDAACGGLAPPRVVHDRRGVVPDVRPGVAWAISRTRRSCPGSSATRRSSVLTCPGKAARASFHGARNLSSRVITNPRTPVSRSMTSFSSPSAAVSSVPGDARLVGRVAQVVDRQQQEDEGSAHEQRDRATREHHATREPGSHVTRTVRRGRRAAARRPIVPPNSARREKAPAGEPGPSRYPGPKVPGARLPEEGAPARASRAMVTYGPVPVIGPESYLLPTSRGVGERVASGPTTQPRPAPTITSSGSLLPKEATWSSM